METAITAVVTAIVAFLGFLGFGRKAQEEARQTMLKETVAIKKMHEESAQYAWQLS